VRGFDVDEVAAHRLGQHRQIGKGRDDADLVGRVDQGRQQDEREYDEHASQGRSRSSGLLLWGGA
jgi:hypothetical protein